MYLRVILIMSNLAIFIDYNLLTMKYLQTIKGGFKLQSYPKSPNCGVLQIATDCHFLYGSICDKIPPRNDFYYLTYTIICFLR